MIPCQWPGVGALALPIRCGANVVVGRKPGSGGARLGLGLGTKHLALQAAPLCRGTTSLSPCPLSAPPVFPARASRGPQALSQNHPPPRARVVLLSRFSRLHQRARPLLSQGGAAEQTGPAGPTRSALRWKNWFDLTNIRHCDIGPT
eukprot:1690910-Rhodomonas_salina.3